MHTTTSTAATELGLSIRRVNELCAANNIGTLINPRCRLLSAADVKLLAKIRGPVGNPNFGPDFWRKKRRKRKTK